jgi:hypothetical protein
MSGSWTQRDGIALAEGLCDLGGIIWAEGLHDGGAMPLFQLYSFALQLRKSTENRSQGSRLVLDASRRDDLAPF